MNGLKLKLNQQKLKSYFCSMLLASFALSSPSASVFAIDTLEKSNSVGNNDSTYGPLDEEMDQDGEDQQDPDLADAQDPQNEQDENDDATTSAAGLPKRRVLKGTRGLTCVGIKWQNMEKVGATAAGCQYVSDKISEFYRTNSRGLFTITPTNGYQLAVPFNGSNKNLAAAEKIVKDTYKADMYIVPSIFTGPHASGGIAHVKSAQFMTATHEVGHLLGLAHAGSYTFPGGKPVLNAYGDKRSIMGRIISRYITAPQYYFLGWLPDSEFKLHDPSTTTYNLKRISDFKVNGLATVILPPTGKDSRYAFISTTTCLNNGKKTCVNLHMSTGSGSQRVAEIEDEFYDVYFTGVHIKVLGYSKNNVTQISVDFKPKP
jgi:hypothetical protein